MTRRGGRRTAVAPVLAVLHGTRQAARQAPHCAALVAALFVAPSASAQDARGPQATGLGAAEALVRAGRVREAEDLLYRQVARAPRRPTARAALGRWLLARGATRPGAILLEEALYFGGDSTAIGPPLAAAYTRLGDWGALARLAAPVPDGAAVRRRAGRLQALGSTARLQAPTAVALAPGPPGTLGVVTLRVAGRDVRARLEAGVHGVRVDPATAAAAGAVRDGATLGTLPEASLGGLSFTQLPVTIGDGPVRVGLDVLAAFRPTVDAGAGCLRLVPPPARRTRSAGATGWPVLRLDDGWWVAPPDGGLVPLAAWAAAPGREAWTLEARSGMVRPAGRGTAAGRAGGC